MGTRTDVLHIKELKEFFNSNPGFSSGDIKLFFENYQDEINPTTLKTRIYRLINKGIIKRSGTNLFTLGNEKIFTPGIDKQIKSLHKKLKVQFPLLKFCIWDTRIINHLMLHQPGIFYIIIEVETDKEQRLMYAHSVFNFLSSFHKSVYLDPTSEIFDLYTSPTQDALIVIPMVSEAPLQKIDNIHTITIEKLLVDLFCEKVLFTAQQGAELATIYNNAFDTYTINRNKLLRYAARRNQKKQLMEYLHDLNLV
ncbi:MAG: DUF6577 family protein [Bacteroidales bacterium]